MTLDIEAEFKTVISRLGLDIITQISNSDDPVTFGLLIERQKYLVSVAIKLIEGQASCRASLYPIRKKLFRSSIDWRHQRQLNFVINIGDLQYGPEEVADVIKDAILSSSIDFQKAFLASGEPMTLTMSRQLTSVQIEVIGFSNGKGSVAWEVVVDGGLDHKVRPL